MSREHRPRRFTYARRLIWLPVFAALGSQLSLSADATKASAAEETKRDVSDFTASPADDFDLDDNPVPANTACPDAGPVVGNCARLHRRPVPSTGWTLTVDPTSHPPSQPPPH